MQGLCRCRLLLFLHPPHDDDDDGLIYLPIIHSLPAAIQR